MSGFKARMSDAKPLVCGVAAGMAYQFGWSCLWTRLAWALAVLFNPAMGLVAYFVIALVVKRWERRY